MKAIPTKTSLLLFDTILSKGDIKEGSVVADLGCGRSLFFLYSLAKRVGKDGKVYGVDILPDVIESLERDLNHHSINEISILRANLENQSEVNLKNESVYVAFLINTLNQAANTTSMLNEAIRILTKTGRLIIVDWHSENSPMGPLQSQRISISQIKKVIDASGLTILDEFEAGDYHYGLVVSK